MQTGSTMATTDLSFLPFDVDKIVTTIADVICIY